MKVLEINSCCGCLSTGTIASNIAKDFMEKGDEAVVAYGRSYRDTGVKTYKIGNKFDILLHEAATFLFDMHGLCSKKATKKFLKWADEYDPDLLWLHNIHGFYINYELLFDWIKSRPNMQVKWTLHDCWAFTGHCAYFSYAKCEKWCEGCNHCPQKKSYPKTMLFDRSRRNFDAKKCSFTGVRNMQLITPSKWLADLVTQSFLKEYPVKVKHNTIDCNVFKATPSNFREQFNLQGKKIILGVASTWDKRKGLDDFIKLSSMLDENYAIVLVGLSEKQIKHVPKKIIAFPRTNSKQELAGLYTTADVHLVLSKEETFGMTVIESIACNTIPLVLKGTACEEVVKSNNIGYAVNDDLGEIKATIIRICGGGILILMNRTSSAKQLAAIYTAADIFVNTTYEDNYPTTNLESQACGTPCITYDTGGSVESVPSSNVIIPDVEVLRRKLEELL